MMNEKRLKILPEKDDKVAFESFFKRYYPKLTAYACLYLEPQAAEDLEQDLFLRFKGNFGADYSESSRDRYWPKTVKWGANNNGVASHTGTKLSSYLAEYTLTFSKKMGSHNLNGVVGYTWQIFNDTYSYQQANNFIDDGLSFLGGIRRKDVNGDKVIDKLGGKSVKVKVYARCVSVIRFKK